MTVLDDVWGSVRVVWDGRAELSAPVEVRSSGKNEERFAPLLSMGVVACGLCVRASRVVATIGHWHCSLDSRTVRCPTEPR